MKLQQIHYLRRKNMMLLSSSILIFILGLSLFGAVKVINARGYSAAISGMVIQTEEVNQMMESFLKPTTDTLAVIKRWDERRYFDMSDDEKFAGLLIPLLSQYSQINGFVFADSSNKMIALSRTNNGWLSFQIGISPKEGADAGLEVCKKSLFDMDGNLTDTSFEVLPLNMKQRIFFPDNELSAWESKIYWENLNNDPIFPQNNIACVTQWKNSSCVRKASVNFCMNGAVERFKAMLYSDHLQIFMLSGKISGIEGIEIYSGDKVPEDAHKNSASAILSDWKSRSGILTAPIRLADLGLLYYVQPFSGDRTMYIGVILYEQLMKGRIDSRYSAFTTASFIVAGFGLAMFFSLIVIHRKEEAIVSSNAIPADESGWKEFIGRGEGKNLEFKSSLRWDMVENCKNAKLEDVILKAIGAFANSDGGVLLIGVKDDGSILGLEKDYSTLMHKNKDGFELQIRELMNRAYSVDVTAKIIHLEFPVIDGLEICAVIISPSPKPLYTKVTDPKRGKVEKFYIRSGNSSREVEQLSDIAKYVAVHFKKNKS